MMSCSCKSQVGMLSLRHHMFILILWVLGSKSLDHIMSAGVQKRSFLLVLDASNMQEMARAWTKHPVTLGFHGNFFGLDAFKAAD